MFIGHFGVGFGAKRVAPSLSLGALILACQLADLIWPTLVIAGVESVAVAPGDTVVTPLRFESYPYSHSLLGLAIWAAIAAWLYRALSGASLRALLVLAAVVLSHWVLDVLTHRPDMPLAFADQAKLGLNLWRSLPATMAVEGVMFAAGVWLYLAATRARDRVGVYAFWGLIVFLAIIYVANLFGPAPPSAAAVAWTAEAMWLLVLWGYWIDRHRVVKVRA
ncbi:MAG TPA: hypothetical protein VFV78_08015 [Vicinamibacterales bacterium]|nr:hypothetical protein [Vicinamibacterales bacterium]